MLDKLEAHESALCDAAADGQIAKLEGKTVRPELVRRLLAGLKLTADESEKRAIAADGFGIENAVFEERLDLRDMRCACGGALTAIAFKACVFKQGVDLRGAHLGRLDFTGSTFGGASRDEAPQLDLRGARIEGDLDLSKVAPIDAENADLWVRASSMRVGGNLTAEKARLRAPPSGDGVNRYALDLDGAVISGDAMLMPGFDATGGLKLKNAEIMHDVWMDCVKLRGRQHAALNLQETRIHGLLSISDTHQDGAADRPLIEGSVWLSGAKIGSVQIFGALFEASIEAPSVAIGDRIRIDDGESWDCSIRGRFAMSGEIGGDLTLGCTIGKPLEAAECRLADLRVKGAVDLSRLSFASTRGSFGKQEQASRSPNHDTKAISLQDAEVGAIKMWDAGGDNTVRVRPLACYPGAELVEAVSIDPNVGVEVVSALVRGADIRTLDGSSNILHETNDNWKVRLTNETEVRDYLELFCAFVWADDGWFRILPGEAQVVLKKSTAEGQPEHITTKAPVIKRDGAVWRIEEAHIVYGASLFKASFSLTRTGEIEMVDDDEIGEARDIPRWVFNSGRALRRTRVLMGDVDPPMSGGWKEASKERKGWILRKLRVEFGGGAWSRLHVDLRGLKCDVLDDADGRSWGDKALLQLERLRYDATAAPESGGGKAPTFWHWLSALRTWTRMLAIDVSRVGSRPELSDFDGLQAPVWRIRERWLRLQYESHRGGLPIPRKAEAIRQRAVDYDPQPYIQIADVLRRSGDVDGARNIDAKRLTIEGRIAARSLFFPPFVWLMLAVHFLYWLGFRYGLSMLRALITPIVFFLIGYGGVLEAQRRDMLVVSTMPVAAVAYMQNGDITPASQSVASGAQVDFSCRRGINPMLYAVDLFIPLIDLGEEGKCGVRGSPSPVTVAPTPIFDEALATPEFWHWAKSIYAVIGWIVMSLSVLTISGVLRGRIERAQ